jgi:hypothetical protein
VAVLAQPLVFATQELGTVVRQRRGEDLALYTVIDEFARQPEQRQRFAQQFAAIAEPRAQRASLAVASQFASASARRSL